MKKTLLAIMLSLGTSMPLQNKSMDTVLTPKINSTPTEKFLKTDNASYHPSMQEFLEFNDISYSLENLSTHNPTKVPTEPEYISEKDLNKLINNLYKNNKVPKIISKDLFKTIIKKESHDGHGYNINAENKYSGARGLGQIMPGTWKEMDPTSNFYIDAINPKKNLTNSLKYLKWIPHALEKMNPEWTTLSKEEKLEQIIASYNWGIGKLQKNDWDFANAPKETQNYKKYIENNTNLFEKQS